MQFTWTTKYPLEVKASWWLLQVIPPLSFFISGPKINVWVISFFFCYFLFFDFLFLRKLELTQDGFKKVIQLVPFLWNIETLYPFDRIYGIQLKYTEFQSRVSIIIIHLDSSTIGKRFAFSRKFNNLFDADYTEFWQFVKTKGIKRITGQNRIKD